MMSVTPPCGPLSVVTSLPLQIGFGLTYVSTEIQRSKAKTDLFQIVQPRLSEVVTVMSRTGENKEKTSSKLRT
jgi:hypothetical protein